MTPYSVHSKDWIFVKGYGFFSFVKNIARNISKSLSEKYSQKFLIMLNKMQLIYLKLLQKGQFKKQQKHLVIWFAIKLLVKLQKSRESQKQLDIVEKDVYL